MSYSSEDMKALEAQLKEAGIPFRYVGRKHFNDDGEKFDGVQLTTDSNGRLKEYRYDPVRGEYLRALDGLTATSDDRLKEYKYEPSNSNGLDEYIWTIHFWLDKDPLPELHQRIQASPFFGQSITGKEREYAPDVLYRIKSQEALNFFAQTMRDLKIARF